MDQKIWDLFNKKLTYNLVTLLEDVRNDMIGAGRIQLPSFNVNGIKGEIIFTKSMLTCS